MVTLPGLVACLYCLWLPFVATRYHPSSSIALIISLLRIGSSLSLVAVCIVHTIFFEPVKHADIAVYPIK